MNSPDECTAANPTEALPRPKDEDISENTDEQANKSNNKRPRPPPNHNSSSWDGRNGRSRRRQRQDQQQQRQKPTPQSVSCCSVCQTENPVYKCPKCREPYCSVECCRSHKENHCQIVRQAPASTDNATNESTEASVTQLATSAKDSVQTPTGPSFLVQQARDLRARQLDQRRANKHRGRGRVLGAKDGDSESESDEHDDLEDGWKLTDSMKDAVWQQASWLRHEFQNQKGLQELIARVVLTDNTVVGAKSRHKNGRKVGSEAITNETTHQEQILHQLRLAYPRFRIFLDKLLVIAGVLERSEHLSPSSSGRRGSADNTNSSLTKWLHDRSHYEQDHELPLVLKSLPQQQNAALLSKLEPKREYESAGDRETSKNSSDSSSTSSCSADSSNSSSSDDGATKTGFDSNVPKEGLLIYHIDEHQDKGFREAGYPGQPGWPENNNHFFAALVQADGKFHLERGNNGGDAGDVFHSGGVDSIGPGPAQPNTDSYALGEINPTGIRIENVKVVDGVLTFDFFADGTSTPAPSPAAVTPAPTQVPTMGPTQATPACVNDPNWTFFNKYGGERDCAWVGKKKVMRCKKIGEDGTSGWESCPESCGCPT